MVYVKARCRTAIRTLGAKLWNDTIQAHRHAVRLAILDTAPPSTA